MLAGVFIKGFVELAQQVLEDIAHLMVRHGGGSQVHLALLVEALHEEVEEVHPAEIADGVVEIEGGEDFPNIRGEAHHILAEVQREIGIIVQEALVGELRGVVKGVSRRAAELAVAVLQALFFKRVLGLKHLVLGLLQRIIKPPQHGERQNDLLKLALLESAVEQVSNRPDKADDVVEFGGFVHV